MKKIEKCIIFVVSIIVIIMIAIMLLNRVFLKQSNVLGDAEEDELNNTTEIERVSEINEYYTVKTIADTYIEDILEENAERLINILDPEYINSFNITYENVCLKLNPVSNYNSEEGKYYKYYIDKMYVSKYKNISTYFVNGTMINRSSETTNKFMFIIELDTNSYYYILPYEFIKKHGYDDNYIEEGKEYTSHLTTIKSTEYNQYDFQKNNDEYRIILDHMEKLTDYLVYNFNNSYSLFETDYKNKKFSTLEKYTGYIQKNISDILSSTIKKYKIMEKQDYIEYVCIDQYGNYYIFKDKGVMDYTVMFDTYSIDSDEFNNKYNKGSEQLKVGMNLEKVFQALNRKDYNYIYEKLDNDFKQTYFDTLTEFETYVKNTFFDINKIEYGEFEEESGVYVYKIVIYNAEKNDEEVNQDKEIIKNFIVKLEENNDFKLSFNID